MQKPSSTEQSSCLEDSENFYTPQDTEPLLAGNQDTLKYTNSRHVQFTTPNDLESGTRAIGSNSYDDSIIIANGLPSISQSSFFSNMSSFSVLGLSVHYRKVDRLWALLLVILFTSFLLFSAFLVGLLSRTLLTLPHQDPPVRNIVLMISDGFGPASQTMARNYKQQVENLDVGFQLPLDTILVGSSRTRSSSSLVTDSAAGATAFSCAKKSYNGAIGVIGTSPRNAQVCGTILEAASEVGMLTGLVVTSRITHATPAAFSAHVMGRDDETAIALQQIGNYSLGRRVDLMMGGGSCMFLPNQQPSGCRPDSLNVFDLAKERFGWNIGSGIADLANTSSIKLPYLNLFADDHMDYSIDRDPDVQPSLAEMAKTALEVLHDSSSKNQKKKQGQGHQPGFLLIIEGSRIDMAAHSNDPATHIHEILAYNEAITQVLEFVNEHPDTLLISTSDHETGGLSVAVQMGETYPIYAWAPLALSTVQKSAEYIAKSLLNLNPIIDRKDFINSVIFRNWLGVEREDIPYFDEYAQYLTNPNLTQTQIEYKIGQLSSSRALVGWSTHGHSAVDVNLYAHGPRAYEFKGNHENTDIGVLISNFLKLDLDAITFRLNATHFL